MLHLHPRRAVILIQSGHLSHKHRSDNLMAKKLRICRWFSPASRTDFTAIGEFALPFAWLWIWMNYYFPELFSERVHVFSFVCHGQAVFTQGKIPSKNAREGQLWWQHFSFKKAAKTRKWKCNLEHLEEKSATITLSGDFDGPYLPSNLNWSKLKLRDMFDYRRYLQVSIVDFQYGSAEAMLAYWNVHLILSDISGWPKEWASSWETSAMWNLLTCFGDPSL